MMASEFTYDGGVKRIRLLGSGGIGDVFLVQMQNSNYFAFKTLNSQNIFNKKALQSLKTEYDMLSNLVHPNIIRAHGWANILGDIGILMEYIDGHNPSWEKFVSAPVKKKICQAVRYLRSLPQPIVHNDIKPSNVIVEPTGRVVLLDFSAAYYCGTTPPKIGRPE